MAGPITIGAIAALVLSMASETALKGAVGEAVRDTYKALKQKVAHWAAGDVEALELNPTSAPRRAVIAEAIDQQPETEKISIKILATELAEALKQSAQSLIGIDARTIEAARITLDGISVHEGIGIRAETIKASSDLEVKNLNVGNASGKAAQ